MIAPRVRPFGVVNARFDDLFRPVHGHARAFKPMGAGFTVAGKPEAMREVDEKSSLHSLTRILANKRRKLWQASSICVRGNAWCLYDLFVVQMVLVGHRKFLGTDYSIAGENKSVTVDRPMPPSRFRGK